MIIDNDVLINMGFNGPYMHGEFFLYDEDYSVQVEKTYTTTEDGESHTETEDWCCIMSIMSIGDNTWECEYNSQRGMWVDTEGYISSGFLECNDIETLKRYIEKSKNLVFK